MLENSGRFCANPPLSLSHEPAKVGQLADIIMETLVKLGDCLTSLRVQFACQALVDIRQ